MYGGGDEKLKNPLTASTQNRGEGPQWGGRIRAKERLGQDGASRNVRKW